MPTSSDNVTADVRVNLPVGVDLHARPAAEFVRTAMGYSARVWVVVGEREADAKSLLSILALGAKAGTSLRLRAEGVDAPAALHALAAAGGDRVGAAPTATPGDAGAPCSRRSAISPGWRRPGATRRG